MQDRIRDFFDKNRHLIYQYPVNATSDVDWILDQSEIPYLRLVLPDMPFETMLAEARALGDLYVGHRDSESHRGWSSICVHGISSQHTQNYNAYAEYTDLDEQSVPYGWTEIADRCPTTVAYFRDRFPYDRYSRLRFMRLDAGGYIAPHHDHDRICLAPINISLNNPPGCDFMFENVGLVPFSNHGSAFAISVGINHCVWNQSPEARYHIIVHGRPRRGHESFDRMILESYRATQP